MLLLNISPIYLKFGVLLEESESLNKEFEYYKEKFKYINPRFNINYKTFKLFLFQINYFKFDDFEKSPDFEFLSKLNILRESILEEKQKEEIEKNLLNNKDSNIILKSPILKNNEIQSCYYSGNLTGKIEYSIYKLFHRKCEKYGDIIKLSISAIDYLNNNIENTFFDLPKGSINDLVIIGKSKNENTILTNNNKNKINLKDNLYPYLMTNGCHGLELYRIDSINSYKKIGYNTLGPTSLWSLFNLTCNYDDVELALKQAREGNNELIDLSVGDIYGGDYGGASLCSDLIASSFSKVSNLEDINKLDKKDIGKALLIFYGVTYAQVAAMISDEEKIEKNIILGDTFDSLELKQMIQSCQEAFTGNKIRAIFNEYSNYIEIIGMVVDLDKDGLLKI
jgi:pantothenate kinase